MVKEDKSTWKSKFFLKVTDLFQNYNKCFIVGADNVGSNQMQKIRITLRGKAVVLMGKNTMIRKALRSQVDANPALEKILPLIKGNVGFVATDQELEDVRDLISQNKLPAPAKAGAIAPCDVFIDPANTGLGPEKTSFFQALSIPTKITKGTIEILSKVHLIKEGDKVGASDATLLNMLNIQPFSYSLKIEYVYDNGSVFDPAILDITDDDLRAKFMVGVRNVAALSLAIGYPTAASVPHSIVNGFKNLLAVAAATDVTFKEAETLKEFLADPGKFAAAAAASAPASSEAPKEEAKKEESDESDDDMGFGLFD